MPLDPKALVQVSNTLQQNRTALQTLDAKVRLLTQSRSTDPLQQLQSDIIVELYRAVLRLQDATTPLFEVLLPSVSGARDAASHGGTTTNSITRPFTKP